MTQIDVSATNVIGMGATRLAQSLLPALERRMNIRRLLVPQAGELAAYRRVIPGPAPLPYRRRLPNGLSRILECTVNSRRVANGIPLLILGDLPVRANVKQVVLVHQSHLAGGRWTDPCSLKFRLMRFIFEANLSFISTAVVQSEMMKALLQENYPDLSDRIVVITQPAPAWVLNAEKSLKRPFANRKLNLFYPAADYPHKNHEILKNWSSTPLAKKFVGCLKLTIAPPKAQDDNLILYVGNLPPDEVIDSYREADALIFPSIEESLGLPLVEAMFLGLPILCSDRPFARSLCGDEAIYFDPEDVKSVQRATEELFRRLSLGWRPDWSDRLENVPKTWDEVADDFAELF